MYGRIRNLVVNPVYTGEHHYGRKTLKQREIIIRQVPAIVEPETWDRAREALRHNQLTATRNAKRLYLLRGLITCGICGLSYTGTRGVPPHTYYCCNGTRPPRAKVHGRCPSKFIPAGQLEGAIWQDIRDFLQDPALFSPNLPNSSRCVMSRLAISSRSAWKCRASCHIKRMKGSKS